jgi:prepilin-type N-terminal cleavage/methylation domain-containing protein
MPVRTGSRRAFTLIEVLITIVLFGMVMAVLMKIVVGQQRFYHGAAEMIETQTSVREAVSVLQSDLRALSPSRGDLIGMSDTSITFMEPIGASVVCVIGGGRTSLVLPPKQLAANNALTAWVRQPEPGDRILVYDLGTSDASADDTWGSYGLSAIPSSGGTCPMSTGFTTTAAEESQGYTLQIDAPLTTNVVEGSSVRILRQAKFTLYQAGDGRWYLGFQECPGGTCDPIQPVSGPYLPPGVNGGAGGLSFTYYDSTGTVTANQFTVARIDVVTRAATRSSLHIPGLASGHHVDSLRTTIALRN